MNDSEITIPIEAKIKYIERRRKDLEGCLVALTNQDYKFLEKVGHDLKGNAITFGFDPLSTLGEKLETAANHKDLEEAKTLIGSYGEYLKTCNPH